MQDSPGLPPLNAGPQFPNMSVKKILIIKLRAIGDVVMSTIVIKNLRALYPMAQIDFLTEKPGAMVVAGIPHLNSVRILPRNRKKSSFGRFIDDVRFIREIQKQKYDLVIDYFGNPRSALLTWLSGASFRVGYDYRIRQLAYNHVIKSRASYMHEALWHLDALQYLGIPIVSRQPEFYIGADAEQFAREFWDRESLNGMPVVGINFSGGWPAKRWPLDQFAELINRFAAEYPVRFLVLWGPGEKEDALKLVSMAPEHTLLIPPTDLKQLGAILKRLNMMVTTDSGPMHIAAALQVPCVAIYGPTNYKLQGPFGNIHEIVYKDDLDCLGCNRLDCDHTSCMNALGVDRVYAGVKRCIEKNKVF